MQSHKCGVINLESKDVKKLEEEYHMGVYNRLPIVLEKGEGVYLYDNEGREYLDFAGGIAVNSLGHNHPDVTEALQDQAEKLLHSSNLYYFEIQSRLARLLVENSCADRVFFANSGAEANEGALKLARRYLYNRDDDRREVLVAQNSFHGRTLATLAATAQPKYQKPFGPLPSGFKEVAFDDLAALEEAVSEETAAIMLEPVQGEGGVKPASQDYLEGVRELCDQEDLLFILDEVQTGIGRTGRLFAHEHYGVKPDIFTSAKALGSGVPISCLLARGEVAEAFAAGDHATTFGGNPLACRAAHCTVSTIVESDLMEDVRGLSGYFLEGLEELAGEYDWINEARGLGLLLGIEVEKSPKDILQKMIERNILTLVAGENVVRFAPPLIIEREHVDEVLSALDSVCRELD